jgi:LysM repeat protein/lysophospholipase L1-like esterase
MKVIKNILLSIIFIGGSAYCDAQRNTIMDSTLLSLEHHVIRNDSLLNPFIRLVKTRDTQTNRAITIVHIGDSHVQGPVFPGAIRENLQAQYGNAGRGFIFPYQVAKTNGDSQTRFNSDDSWQSMRNVKSDGNDDIGISGISLETNDSDFELELHLKKELQGTKQIEILSTHPEYFNISNERLKKKNQSHRSASFTNKYYTVKKGDNLNAISQKYNTTVSDIQRLNALKGTTINVRQRLIVQQDTIKPVIQSDEMVQEIPQLPESLKKLPNGNYILPEVTESIYITAVSEQERYNIDGMILRNDRPGIQYHAIGVNGAQFTDYTKFPRFFEQLAYLNPDLIIVSLGTNESFSDKLTTQEFTDMLYAFDTQLKKHGVIAPVLATSPPPSLKNKKHPNTKATTFASVLREESNLLGWSFYDLHEVAGSSANMNMWHKRNLTASDRIHYNTEGYSLLGTLISDILTKTIER